jgi:uncharacterized membrane protein
MMGLGFLNGCCGWGRVFGMHGWIGLVLNILTIIGILWLVVWAVRRITRVGGRNVTLNQSPDQQSPIEILHLRYARGEITREQYKEMLKDLNDLQ